MSISDISSISLGQGYSSGDARSAADAAGATVGRKPLSQEEQQDVSELKHRDTEVRAHESAHVAAGGAYVRGGPNYEYKTGPDGKQYAVGGEVSIDTSPVSGNPQATITKMQIVRRAALAPANPSGQDQSVAAQASSVEGKARQEIAEQRFPQGGSRAFGEGGGAPETKSQPGFDTEPAGDSQPSASESAISAYSRHSVFTANGPGAPRYSFVDIVG